MSADDSPAPHPPSATDLLNLYTHARDLADANLSVEREITIKNYLALGAVLLLQAGFFTSAMKTHVVFVACGAVVLTVSLAARAMAIFYSNYSVRLFAYASVYRKAFLRGRDGQYITVKMDELHREKKLPDAENLSLKEYVSDTGALATINTLPAVLGLVLVVLGGTLWYHDPQPGTFLRTDAKPTQNTYVSIFPPLNVGP